MKIVKQPPQSRITCERCGETDGRTGYYSVINPPNPTVDFCPTCWVQQRPCPTCEGSGYVVADLTGGPARHE